MPLDEFAHYFSESKISTKQRKKLDDSQFGIPSLRKYPLTDEKHVLQAVRFFNKAPEEHKPELARNIVKRAKELNMDWEKWDVLKPYLDKPVKEAAYAKELHSTPEADKICKSVKYDNAPPSIWRLKSPDEVMDKNLGNCHDTSYYAYMELKYSHDAGLLFFIEYNSKTDICGATHSVCYEKLDGYVVGVDLSWNGGGMTIPADNVKELAERYKNMWDYGKGFDSLLCVDVTDMSGIHPGMTLDEYVKYVVSHSRYIFNTSVKESFVPDDLTSGTSDFDNDDNDPEDCYTESNKERVNDKGEKVPEKCNKCGSPIKVYLQGEPIYQCSNKKCKKYFGTLPCNINESADTNGITNAKLIAARIHEKVQKDSKPPTGNQNCQLCVWCAEAQFRGRTDMPRPVYSPRDPVLNISGESIVIHPRVFSMKAGFDDVLDILADRPYARFYCHAKWKEGNGGHEFIIITEDEYKCYIMDPQQGTVDKFLETHPYIKDIKWEDSYLARLDDAEFNETVLRDFNTEESIVPWDAKLDIPFMLKEGMITKEEAEQYWKDHPNETSNDRHFLSYEELDRISESKNIFTSGDFTKYGKDVDLNKARGPIQERYVVLDKTKHKTEYLPSNVFTLDEYKRANKYRSVIVGEIHNSSMLKFYDKLLSERNPEYFISEFAHEDRVLSLPELKQKLDVATNGKFKPGIPDYQDNYAIYKLAYDHGCKLIGCDLNNGKHYSRMNDEDHEREAYMLKVLKEFENTNFVCQLGDHHLRSIPITKEFLNYCGDTKDDRGIVSDLTVDNASPIWTYFTHEPKDVAILREPNELKNELGFINQQTIQESYTTLSMLERYVPHASENLPDGIWMRPAVKADTEYIFNVEWDTLDDKWKDDPKVLDMFKKDARESVPRTRIICYTDEQNNSQTIGLLQAYQKDDYWYIGEIWLKPEFRGKGYGKAILENEISKHDWLSLDVNKKNKHAIDLYVDLGFRIVSENEDGYRMDLKKNSDTIQEGSRDGDKEKQHQKNNKQNNKQIKEEYSMDMFERDPSILKMIMESENDSEDNNTKPEGEGIDELDITIDDDGDGDAISIGIDDTNEQNQYDPKEVETLNKLIASEADAISDYFEAGKATRVPVLSKLYSDIGEEERFHLEQLLYAKSTVTGEKYEPRDPKVREEYNELLSMGMDEETAMTTAVDKLSISISDEDELSDNEIEDIKEGFDMIANMSRFTSLTYDVILDAIADESDIKTSMYTEYMNIIEEAFVMEEVDNLNRPGTAREAKGKSIIKTVLGAFRALLNLVGSLTRKAKLAFTKIRLKDKRRWAWIKKHGIKALFQEGVSMFFWSDKRNRYEVGQAFTFLQIIHVMNVKIIKDCKINVNISQFEINDFIRKLSNITKAPDDSNELINRIMNANIAEGVKTLNGMVLSKAKVLVTEENEAYLEQLFFGYTNDKYNMVMAADDGSQKNVDLSQNIYNQLDILLSALERVSKETGLVLETLDKMEGQGGVYASNPKLYNTCVQALSVMTKSTNKFISAVSNDISAAFKLNKGLKELVDQADQATNNTEKTEALKNVNQYQADQAQANQERQAEANKTKAQENTTKYGARTI